MLTLLIEGDFKTELEDSLREDLEKGNVESAYSTIATAFKVGRSQDVLKV